MSKQRWYPTTQQLKDTGSLERSFRQLLNQHYTLVDRFNELLVSMGKPVETPTGPPPGCGPADTQILGLSVAPMDSQTLADGAKLTWVKKDGVFKFL